MNRFFVSVVVWLCLVVMGGAATSAFAQTFDWSGFYLGGQVGGQLLNSRSSFKFFSPVAVSAGKDFRDGSFMGGGQTGYNWQPNMMPLFLGIEADLIGTSHENNRRTILIGGPDQIDARSELDVQGSIRGRLGWAFDRLLLYGTVGVGFGAGKATTIAACTCPGTVSASATRSKTLVGWTLGGGLEYMLPFSDHWSLRGEYRFTDLGAIDVQFPGANLGGAPATIVAPYRARADFRTHNFIFAINYNF